MWIGGQVIVFFFLALTLLPPTQAAVFNIPAGDVAALIAAINTAHGNGVLYPQPADNSRIDECGKIVSFSCHEKGTALWPPIHCFTNSY
jgi:hypothetical protein